MPPDAAVNYSSWILIGFASGFIAYRYYRAWWARHNYVLSAALVAGLAFMGCCFTCVWRWSMLIWTGGVAARRNAL
ncbi:hypothetical protein L6164_001003 [Bauhinia variegata]|uniref:Uncharacterized protein n=1 Tax=Bauhinia variegata TaxID=167791 RepID=A0ACB9Q891_BAUVA|nr:hypothetical protein L6164_001003 [Bauhinia variegata]